MSDEAGEPEKFLIQLPVWVVADKERLQTFGLTPSVVTAGSPEVGDFVPLFTDEDLVQRFMVANPHPNATRIPLANGKALRVILTAWCRQGVNNVGIDITITPDGRISGRFYPTDTVLGCLPADRPT